LRLPVHLENELIVENRRRNGGNKTDRGRKGEGGMRNVGGVTKALSCVMPLVSMMEDRAQRPSGR
jgi:hypothetical protein